MVRIREGDEGPTTNTQVPLYAEEKQSIVPGPMDWGALMAKVKALETLSKSSLAGTPLGALLPDTMSTEGMVAIAESINQDLRRWIDGYSNRNPSRIAVLGFKYHWTILRVWVPLQLRLACEQVLYEKGEPWKYLVTGFGVVK